MRCLNCHLRFQRLCFVGKMIFKSSWKNQWWNSASNPGIFISFWEQLQTLPPTIWFQCLCIHQPSTVVDEKYFNKRTDTLTKYDSSKSASTHFKNVSLTLGHIMVVNCDQPQALKKDAKVSWNDPMKKQNFQLDHIKIVGYYNRKPTL